MVARGTPFKRPSPIPSKASKYASFGIEPNTTGIGAHSGIEGSQMENIVFSVKLQFIGISGVAMKNHPMRGPTGVLRY